MNAFALQLLDRLRFPGPLPTSLYRNRLTILMYHGILSSGLDVRDWCFLEAALFRKQMEFLRDHSDVVPLATAVERLKSGEIHRPTVAITFDDGYQNNFRVAFPILRQLGLPATIFLCTGLIGSDDTIWFCRLLEALTETKSETLEWRGRTYFLRTSESKTLAAAALQTGLKKLGPEELVTQVRDLCGRLGCDFERPIAFDSPFRILDRSSISEMLRSGLIEFGAHTCSHAILTRLSQAEQKKEIECSVAEVAQLTDRPCVYFSYPNGTPQDYDRSSMQLLSSLGIQAAVTTIRKSNIKTTSTLELGRYGVGSDSKVLSESGHVTPAPRLDKYYQVGNGLGEQSSSTTFAARMGAFVRRMGDAVEDRLLFRDLQHEHQTRLKSDRYFHSSVSSILFVSRGNACRSSVAECYWNDRLLQVSSALPKAASAGLSSDPDRPAQVESLNRAAIDDAGMIFAMDLYVYREVVADYPDAKQKTYLLGLFARPDVIEVKEHCREFLTQSLDGLAHRMSNERVLTNTVHRASETV